MNRALPKRFASGQCQRLCLLLCCAGVIAGCSSGTVSGQPADDTGAKPGVVRLVRGPDSEFLEGGETLAQVFYQGMSGLAGWVGMNRSLTVQAERLLSGQLAREELEINSKDELADVAIKTVLQNLPFKMTRTAAGANILFQRKRRVLRTGNRVMERDSAEHKRWLETQIKGLEDAIEEVDVEEFLQGQGLVMCISSEPDVAPQTVLFTVTASLSPGRKWTGERWEAGSISLQDFKVSIKQPKDRERERLFREKLFTPKVISGFGVDPVDTMVWPPTPLREQYPLLDLLAEDSDAECFAALQKAAQKGDAEAQFLLGRAYERGEGTAVNLSLAAKWWEESAKRGFAPGVCAHGEAYLRGIGRATDKKQGLEYLEKAVGLGNGRAMTLLGIQEIAMKNTNQPGVGGLARIQKAAAAGDPPGLWLLSMAYLSGAGVPKDQARAEQLQRAAAAWGDPLAMLGLGRRYLARGKERQAWPWLYLAAKYNTTLLGKEYEVVKKEAISDILRLRRELSATDLEAAQRDGAALEAVYRPIWTR